MKQFITLLTFMLLIFGSSCGSKEKNGASAGEKDDTRTAETVQALVDKINSHDMFAHYDGTFRDLAKTNVARIHGVEYIPDNDCVVITMGDNHLYWGISNGHITDNDEIKEWACYDIGLFKSSAVKDLLKVIDEGGIGLVCVITSVGSPKHYIYNVALNDNATVFDDEYMEDEFQPDDSELNAL